VSPQASPVEIGVPMFIPANNAEEAASPDRMPYVNGAPLENRWPRMRTTVRKGLSIICGTVAVGLITFAAFKLHLNLTTAALLHLIVVVLIARYSGFWAASIISAVAVVCQLYFLVPPVLTFVVSDPQNWIALAAFEYCALIVSSLSGHATRQTLDATERRKETEGLYEISRRVLIMDRGQEPGLQLAALIQQVFHCESVGIFDAESNRFAAAGDAEFNRFAAAGDAEFNRFAAARTAEPDLQNRTKDTYIGARDRFEASDNTWFCVLRMGVRPVGALALRGGGIGEPVARALASLAAVAMERSRSLEKQSRAEAARQSEQLRTAVLDALAHDVKTPLTAIRAASSGLLEVGGLAPRQAGLVTLIDNEAGRLDEMTNRLLGMARLDEKEVRLKPRSLRLDMLVRDAVVAFERRTPDRAIQTSGLTAGMIVAGDDRLLGVGLVQLIDNAIKYSAPDSAISISAEACGEEVVLSVHNRGTVIPPADLERIFERFYRAAGTSHQVAGTGLGLSITRKIAAAHAGRVWATSDADKGTIFFLALPASPRVSSVVTRSATHQL
jgi:two-component system, OmpR family, sensor histidine kinase KdpD